MSPFPSLAPPGQSAVILLADFHSAVMRHSQPGSKLAIRRVSRITGLLKLTMDEHSEEVLLCHSQVLSPDGDPGAGGGLLRGDAGHHGRGTHGRFCQIVNQKLEFLKSFVFCVLLPFSSVSESATAAPGCVRAERKYRVRLG